MTDMQYQEFGKTGLRVSKLCLGTWGIGGAGWDSYSDESRMDAIKAALECGINFIDTAGIRETEDIVEKIGVDKSKKTADASL